MKAYKSFKVHINIHQNRPYARQKQVSKFRWIGVIQGIFLDYNITKLEINEKYTSRKSLNLWKISNRPLNTLCAKEEISGAIGKYFELDNNKVIICYDL